MKYMLLMYGNTKAFDESMWSPSDIKAMIDFMGEVGNDLAESGELLEARGLAGPDQAKIVQAQPAGEPLVTDGPFPESKEVLAGYWVVDVADEARAIEIAARISTSPGVGGGPSNMPIHLHPIGEAPEV